MKTIMPIFPTSGYILFTDLNILVLIDTLFPKSLNISTRKVRDQTIFFDLLADQL